MSDPSVIVNVPGEGSSQEADAAANTAEAEASKPARSREQAIQAFLAAVRLGGSASELAAIQDLLDDPGT